MELEKDLGGWTARPAQRSENMGPAVGTRGWQLGLLSLPPPPTPDRVQSACGAGHLINTVSP